MSGSVGRIYTQILNNDSILTIDCSNITISGECFINNILLTAGDYITASSTDTLTNKSIAYSQLTGTPTIPSNNNQLTNGAAFITASSSDTLTNKSIAYSQLTGTPTIPSNNNQLTNGAGFITASSSDTLTNKSIAYSQLTGTPTIPSNNNQLTNGAGFITASALDYNSLSNKPTIPTNNNQLSNGAGYITASSLDYNSLSNKPTIPTNNNQLSNGAGYITSNGVPSQSGNNGKILSTDGSTLSWITAPSGGGNVTTSNTISSFTNNAETYYCVKTSGGTEWDKTPQDIELGALNLNGTGLFNKTAGNGSTFFAYDSEGSGANTTEFNHFTVGAIAFSSFRASNQQYTNLKPRSGTAGIDEIWAFNIKTSTLDAPGGGPIYIYNGFSGNTSSDDRLKSRTENITGALSTIENLNGYKYLKHQDHAVPVGVEDADLSGVKTKLETGVIAQDLKNIPELAHIAQEFEHPVLKDKFYDVKYEQLTPFLVEAIKELKTEFTAEINALKAEINALKS